MSPDAPAASDPPIDVAGIRRIADTARRDGRDSLREHEGYEVLRCAGIAVPAFRLVRDAAAAAACDLGGFRGDRVVVKVVASGIAHKTEAGGVAIVPRTSDAVAAAVRGMAARIGDAAAEYLIVAFVEHAAGLGGELLVSLRWTDDFGPVVTVGAGGTDAEAIARHLLPDARVSIVSPALTPRHDLPAALAGSIGVELATASLRGMPPRLPMDRLADVVARFGAVADACCPTDVVELEVNPFAVTDHGLVALDVLARVGPGAAAFAAPRRLDGAVSRPDGAPACADAVPSVPGAPDPTRLARIRRLLEPKTVAIIGVSSRMNPGRIILRNLLRDGFDPARVHVVKPGVDAIDGCRCVPDLASLPGPVDLLVVAVSAAEAPAVVAEAVERDATGGMLVIPGGLGEKEGSGPLVDRMREALAAARARGGGPVVNGGNCLGIRSRPGGYDTMFIPTTKLPGPAAPPWPVALVSQSGGFAVSRMSRLGPIEPRYVISVGNQVDLTVGDYVAYLAEDPAVEVVGVYSEGFARGDGLTFLRAAKQIVASGRSVLLYRGGRTHAGAAASASHTASIAGDAAVSRALAREAGVVVADSLAEFDDLLATFALLAGRRPRGPRLAAVTNAGFECVAIADESAPLRLAPFEGATFDRIRAVLERGRIDGVVDVHDPLDLTPMVAEEAYEEVVRTVLADEGVDLAIVGVVPLAPPLVTLAPSPEHDEDVAAPGAIGPLLVRIFAESSKPWVAVVDAGPLYDPLRRILEAGGIPTFGTADAAVRALGRWWAARAGGATRTT